VRLTDVTKSYGPVQAVDGLSLEIVQGERVTLLGPSGCGKTTTLNLIAGFLEPDSGSIRIGSLDVAGVPVHKRNIGMVFQSYALFPHLTVFDNVGFGLAMRRAGKADTAARVREVLSVVRLSDFADRYPRQLSGGQQQRVALARALVIRPEIMLLDEPLSNLDAKLRQEMRSELVEILGNVETTVIFVTHDQEEALALSDRVVVLNDGKVEQIGSPAEVYEHPATGFVAKFLGESNILHGIVVEAGANGAVCDIGGGRRVRSAAATGLAPGERVEVIVRVERMRLTREPTDLANSYPAVLEQVMYLGSDIRYGIRLGDHLIKLVEKNRGDGAVFQQKQEVYLEWSDRESFVVKAA
jgi:spermidine/putrescine ABC transporter ATP-binding subunit